MAAWYSGQLVKPAASCSRMTRLVSSVSSASSSVQSLTQRIMLAGLPHRIRLSSSGRRSRTYCMASMRPHELPNRCRRSRSRAERTWASSTTNRSTFHKERSPGRSERPQPLVVEDDPPPVRQGFERLEVVVGEAGTAVQAQQRGRLGVVAHSAVPDLATRDVEVTLVDLHAALCWRPSASSLSATFGDRPGSRE